MVRSEVIAEQGWLAAPLVGAPREPGQAAESEFVLLVRGTCPESCVANVAQRISDALVVVERQVRASARINRLQTILTITHEWHQTNDMETLLVRMAEAATRLAAARHVLAEDVEAIVVRSGALWDFVHSRK